MKITTRRLATSEHIALVLLLGGFVFLGTLYNFSLPILEGPDEMSHFAYVKHLADGKGLAVYPQNIQDPLGDIRYQFYQPPLYYLIGALATFWIDTDDFPTRPERNPYWGYRARAPDKDNKNLFLHTPDELFSYQRTALAVHLLRFVSTLAGGAAVIATYLISRSVFPGRRWLGAVASAFVALNPQFLHISAVVSNDALTAALVSWTLWFILQDLNSNPSLRIQFGWGVMLGLALLSKDSALLLLPLTLLELILVAKAGRPLAKILRQGALLLCSVLVLGGWWHGRNLVLYGQPLGIQTQFLISFPPPLETWMQNVLGLETSFWASFGWGNIYPNHWVYRGVEILDRLAILGLLITVIRAAQRVHNQSPFSVLQGLLLAIWTFLILVAGLVYALVNPWPAGRHLFPALPAIAVLLTLGLDQWRLPRTSLSLALPALLFLAGVAVWAPFGYIAPAYAPPPRYASESEVAIPHRAQVDFDGRIELLGYQIALDQKRDEPVLWVTLYWRPGVGIEENYSVFVHLLDAQGQIVAQRDTYPGLGNYPTSAWAPGEVIQDTYPVHLPPGLPSATYRVRVGLYFLPTLERLPVLAADRPVEGGAVEIARLDLSAASS